MSIGTCLITTTIISDALIHIFIKNNIIIKTLIL